MQIQSVRRGTGHVCPVALSVSGAILAGGALVSSVGAAPPVEWSPSSGGNGHWYQLVETQLDWQSARAYAEAQHGHLATPTTQAENTFVRQLAGNVPEVQSYVWLGGFAPNGQGNNTGAWQWVSGEPWQWANWHPGEPNYSNECALAYRFAYGEAWNNYVGGASHAFVIEWDADCDLDGLADFGQILSGAYEDLDGDGRPDCCDYIAPCGCPSDLDRSGIVDGADLYQLLGNWNLEVSKIEGDTNEDGVVDGADLAMMFICWGDCNDSD